MDGLEHEGFRKPFYVTQIDLCITENNLSKQMRQILYSDSVSVVKNWIDISYPRVTSSRHSSSSPNTVLSLFWRRISLICLISSQRIIESGIIVIVCITAVVIMQPQRHPHAVYVQPTMNQPIAAPTLPMPSIMPVTVETALVLRSGMALPMSAEQVAAIVLVTPCMKKPQKKKLTMSFW